MFLNARKGAQKARCGYVPKLWLQITDYAFFRNMEIIMASLVERHRNVVWYARNQSVGFLRSSRASDCGVLGLGDFGPRVPALTPHGILTI